MGQGGPISFVVVTFNSEVTITTCLDSIAIQDPPPHEVTVVDNASSDRTTDLVESKFPDTKLLKNQVNSGYGQANNVGVRRSLGDFVAVVNPDVRLDKKWSVEMLELMAREPHCAAAEGKLLLATAPSHLNCAGSNLSVLGFGCPTGFGSKDAHDSSVRPVSYPSGAAFITRRDRFVSIGGFDETYFLYHEDVDLGLRFYSAGWSVMYTPDAIAFHESRSGLPPEKVLLLERNRWRTLAKNMPSHYFRRFGPLLALAEIGILVYGLKTGMAHAKFQANLDFLRQIPALASLRRARRRQGKAQFDLCAVMTNDFPQLLPHRDKTIALGEAVQGAFYRAFLRDHKRTCKSDDHSGNRWRPETANMGRYP